MERLTEKISEYIQCNNNECRLSYCDRECEHYKRMVNKLAEYEDAEEQGLLLRLPCKVGDRFWIIAYSQNTRVVEVECVGIEITKTEKKIWIENVLIPRDYWELHFEDFATQYFATKAAAEQALEQMKGGAV